MHWLVHIEVVMRPRSEIPKITSTLEQPRKRWPAEVLASTLRIIERAKFSVIGPGFAMVLGSIGMTGIGCKASGQRCGYQFFAMIVMTGKCRFRLWIC